MYSVYVDSVKKRKPLYIVKRKVDNNFDLNDGETIIYVNCTYNDLSSDIGKLISDLKSKDNTTCTI